jgi:hypothetical protein
MTRNASGKQQSGHTLDVTKENHDHLRLVGIQAEKRIQGLLNTKQGAVSTRPRLCVTSDAMNIESQVLPRQRHRHPGKNKSVLINKEPAPQCTFHRLRNSKEEGWSSVEVASSCCTLWLLFYDSQQPDFTAWNGNAGDAGRIGNYMV